MGNWPFQSKFKSSFYSPLSPKSISLSHLLQIFEKQNQRFIPLIFFFLEKCAQVVLRNCMHANSQYFIIFSFWRWQQKRNVITGYKCLIYKTRNLLPCRNGKPHKLIWMKISPTWISIAEIMSDGLRERSYWTQSITDTLYKLPAECTHWVHSPNWYSEDSTWSACECNAVLMLVIHSLTVNNYRILFPPRLVN